MNLFVVSLLFLISPSIGVSGEAFTIDEFRSITNFEDGNYFLNERKPYTSDCLFAAEMAVVEKDGALVFYDEAARDFLIRNIGGSKPMISSERGCKSTIHSATINKTTKILKSELETECEKSQNGVKKAKEIFTITFSDNAFAYTRELYQDGKSTSSYSCSLQTKKTEPILKEPEF